ncbi:MAG: OmpA family protein [Syntrophomonadaceae bacterium]|jgi:chemotaxis protein MotB|nr:OmpA family protein [Syntrophomonadaceae bacterium]
MAKPKKKNKAEGGVGGGAGMERWLLSYADFITLLMVFFVILYSMSQVDMNKYAQMANALSMVFSGQESVLDFPTIVRPDDTQQPQDADSESILNEIRQEQAQINSVMESISQYIENEDSQSSEQQQTGVLPLPKLSDEIIIYQQERGLVISLKDNLLFESGSDQLTSRARNLIIQVGSLLVDVPNFIRVEGHTDNLPINNARFPSNWELSVLRATNVVHVLNEDGLVPAERISVIGYGEYRPLVPNEDSLTRSMNRRVDIVILKAKYDYFETPAANV